MRQLRRSEEHTSELQSLTNLVCRLLLEKTKRSTHTHPRSSSATSQADCSTHGPPTAPMTPDCPSSYPPVLVGLLAVGSFFFFLNDPAPQEFSPFPHRAPFLI